MSQAFNIARKHQAVLSWEVYFKVAFRNTGPPYRNITRGIDDKKQRHTAGTHNGMSRPFVLFANSTKIFGTFEMTKSTEEHNKNKPRRGAKTSNWKSTNYMPESPNYYPAFQVFLYAIRCSIIQIYTKFANLATTSRTP